VLIHDHPEEGTMGIIRIILVSTVWCLVASVAQADASTIMARGDEAMTRRAEGHTGSHALPEPISNAVSAYEEAVVAEPENLEARVKLLKALYFQGKFTLSECADQLAIYEHALNLVAEGLDQLTRGLNDPSPREYNRARLVEHLTGQRYAVGIYFWAGVHWGLWSRCRSAPLSLKKVRDYSEVVIALDEHYENAGGHRVLGRLHMQAPKIPIITGWVDHKLAILELEKATELAPNDLVGQLFLAEALLEFDPSRRQEALDKLYSLVGTSPNPELLVEEIEAIEDANRRLAENSP
jgi:hypothetical protein